jgi:hypothetical protein
MSTCAQLPGSDSGCPVGPTVGGAGPAGLGWSGPRSCCGWAWHWCCGSCGRPIWNSRRVDSLRLTRPTAAQRPAPVTVVHDSCCQAATHQATPRDLLTDLTHSSAADCQMEATALRAARAARERWAVPAQDMDLGQVRSSSLPSRFSFAALTGCFALMGTSCGNTMALTAARLS